MAPNAHGTLDEDRVLSISSQPGPYFFLVDPDGDLRTNKAIPTGIGGDQALRLIGWNGLYWTSYGQLTGAQGPRGAQGIQGIQGPAGNDGQQGEQGQRGLQGIQGERGLPGADGSAASSLQPYLGWSNQRTVTVEDNGVLLNITGSTSFTTALPDPATLPAGWYIDITNSRGSGVITIGLTNSTPSTVRVYPGAAVRIWKAASTGLYFYVHTVIPNRSLLLNRAFTPSSTDTSVTIPTPVGDFSFLEVEMINMSPSAAAWFYYRVQIGGVIQTTGYQSACFGHTSSAYASQTNQTQALLTAAIAPTETWTGRYRIPLDYRAVATGHGFTSSVTPVVSYRQVTARAPQVAGGIEAVRLFFSASSGTPSFNGGTLQVYGVP